MLTAISRYGARVLPNSDELVSACRKRGELVQGPQIAEFEEAFAQRLGSGHAVAVSYGRMAFYHILRALDLPPGSEIVFPALTFWVVPEIAQVAGLKVVFADVDPRTFVMDPASLERVISPRTRAVVPTHLFGLPCDMDAICGIAGRHNLAIVEDCAHALGATYRGRPVGTFGDGALFSFQTLKPLNTYGGGMAVVQDAAVASRVRAEVEKLPWPDERRVSKKLLLGRAQRVFIRPDVFTWTLFPPLWLRSWTSRTPDIYMWEKVRPLRPLPPDYLERYANVQAVLGLACLEHLEAWTCRTQAHARLMNEALSGLPGVETPLVPPDRTHVYYQYCLYIPDRVDLVRRAIRRGVDVEMRHVDVCTQESIFGSACVPATGAERAARAVQIPVYTRLTDEEVARVARVVRDLVQASTGAPPPVRV